MEFDADLAFVNELESSQNYADYDAQVYGEG
jgi:hypothetical protein